MTDNNAAGDLFYERWRMNRFEPFLKSYLDQKFQVNSTNTNAAIESNNVNSNNNNNTSSTVVNTPSWENPNLYLDYQLSLNPDLPIPGLSISQVVAAADKKDKAEDMKIILHASCLNLANFTRITNSASDLPLLLQFVLNHLQTIQNGCVEPFKQRLTAITSEPSNNNSNTSSNTSSGARLKRSASTTIPTVDAAGAWQSELEAQAQEERQKLSQRMEQVLVKVRERINRAFYTFVNLLGAKKDSSIASKGETIKERQVINLWDDHVLDRLEILEKLLFPPSLVNNVISHESEPESLTLGLVISKILTLLSEKSEHNKLNLESSTNDFNVNSSSNSNGNTESINSPSPQVINNNNNPPTPNQSQSSQSNSQNSSGSVFPGNFFRRVNSQGGSNQPSSGGGRSNNPGLFLAKLYNNAKDGILANTSPLINSIGASITNNHSNNASASSKNNNNSNNNSGLQGNNNSPSIRFKEESFTMFLGLQVKMMQNVTLAVGSLDTLLLHSDDYFQNWAHSLQIFTTLYSGNDLRAMVMMMPRSLVTKLSDPCSSIPSCQYYDPLLWECRKWPECHFPPLEAQLREGICLLPTVQEGDIVISRHSNLPNCHVIFHLIYNDINNGNGNTLELNSQSRLVHGIKSICQLTYRYDIRHLTVPLLLLPDSSSVQFNTYSNATLLKRSEVVLKAMRGYLLENMYILKDPTIAEAPSARTITYLLPPTCEPLFSTIRTSLTNIYRVS